MPCAVALATALGLAGGQATGDDGLRPPVPEPTALTARDARPLGEVQRVEIPPLDVEQLVREDELREIEGLPPRYAIPHPVHLTPDDAGLWERVDEDTMMWRLRVASPDAVSINLGFTRYVMPKGGRLYVYSSDYADRIRPFTTSDNHDHGELWTPPVDDAEVVVEVTVRPDQVEAVRLVLGSINVGYRDFGDILGPGGGERSGSCNVDVVCPDGDGWRDQIATVGVISLGGGTFCTGFTVNNAAYDRTPFFMTANHCGIHAGNAASLVVFWNYENSTCRPAGSPSSGGSGDGSLSQFSSGSTFRAAWSGSDFTLVELSSDPDPDWSVYLAGWDRSSADPTSAVAIHHPNTDEKRISFEYEPTTTTSYLGTSSPGAGTHIRVADWDVGTTEPGSSGSPLFDQNQRVVGQLHGGYAACGNNLADWYGRLSVSWTGGGSPSSRLADWLDPGATGVMTTETVPAFGVGPNDACANAVSVVHGRTPFVTFDATTDGPAHTGCEVQGDGQVECDVWYDYQAQYTGILSVRLCDSGYDTKLAIYDGCACPMGDAALLDCNDDSCGLQSEVTAFVTAGQCYKIRVGGFEGAQGTGMLTLSKGQPNDECADATPLFAGTTLCSNVGATTDGPGHAACDFAGDSQVGSDIWHEYVATFDGDLTVGLCDVDFAAKLAVYDGCGCPVGDAGLLACTDDACGPGALTIPVTNGSCYKIRLGGFEGEQGGGAFVITEPGGLVPCPTDCASGGDGEVDVTDLLEVLAEWGTPGPHECDVNDDSAVDVQDLLDVLDEWGPCG
jgi:hypothetical protein